MFAYTLPTYTAHTVMNISIATKKMIVNNRTEDAACLTLPP